MRTTKTLLAALAATTFLTAGVAYAADQAMQAKQETAQQTTMNKDAGKLSAAGSKAYMEINAARVAIFDGRTDDAKKQLASADTDLGTAKTDETVFMKAEADMNGPSGDATAKGDMAKSDATSPSAKAGDKTASEQGVPTAAEEQAMKTPKQWLPVDGAMSVDEDITANPAKQAAVADANKSLAKGDKPGAMEKLKVADIDIDYALAVVPLKQTISDVHQAATLANDGKYYEASQMLRQVQDSTRYDVLDINGVPKTAGADASKAATH